MSHHLGTPLGAAGDGGPGFRALSYTRRHPRVSQLSRVFLWMSRPPTPRARGFPRVRLGTLDRVLPKTKQRLQEAPRRRSSAESVDPGHEARPQVLGRSVEGPWTAGRARPSAPGPPEPPTLTKVTARPAAGSLAAATPVAPARGSSSTPGAGPASGLLLWGGGGAAAAVNASAPIAGPHDGARRGESGRLLVVGRGGRGLVRRDVAAGGATTPAPATSSAARRPAAPPAPG